eukprot:s4576_g6.t2
MLFKEDDIIDNDDNNRSAHNDNDCSTNDNNRSAYNDDNRSTNNDNDCSTNDNNDNNRSAYNDDNRSTNNVNDRGADDNDYHSSSHYDDNYTASNHYDNYSHDDDSSAHPDSEALLLWLQVQELQKVVAEQEAWANAEESVEGTSQKLGQAPSQEFQAPCWKQRHRWGDGSLRRAAVGPKEAPGWTDEQAWAGQIQARGDQCWAA